MSGLAEHITPGGGLQSHREIHSSRRQGWWSPCHRHYLLSPGIHDSLSAGAERCAAVAGGSSGDLGESAAGGVTVDFAWELWERLVRRHIPAGERVLGQYQR